MYRGTPLPLPVGEAWSRPLPGSGPALCLECGEVKQSKDFNRAPFENFVARSFLDALALSGAWQFARHRKYTLPHWGISICDACMCASRVQAEDRALSFAMGAHGVARSAVVVPPASALRGQYLQKHGGKHFEGHALHLK